LPVPFIAFPSIRVSLLPNSNELDEKRSVIKNNDSDELRVVLIFDHWNPLLNDTEK
jgi:hypothetical protein